MSIICKSLQYTAFIHYIRSCLTSKKEDCNVSECRSQNIILFFCIVSPLSLLYVLKSQCRFMKTMMRDSYCTFLLWDLNRCSFQIYTCILFQVHAGECQEARPQFEFTLALSERWLGAQPTKPTLTKSRTLCLVLNWVNKLCMKLCRRLWCAELLHWYERLIQKAVQNSWK